MDVNALMPALGALVLERLDGGAFVRRGPLPDWCLSLPAPAVRVDEPFALETAFPFLATFVEDAERVWHANAEARVSSGFWTETGTSGEELHLEALPLRVGRSDVLVISRNEDVFRQHQLVLQRARELRLARDALSREIEQKDVLLHTIVSDMASPLGSILGMLSLLSEAPLGESAAGCVHTAFEAAVRQKQLIGEVLEVFSAEHDEPARSPAEMGPDLCKAIAQVVSDFAAVARGRTIRLEPAPCAAPCPVVGEERRLVRVLANLVDNALRNSPSGGTVRVAVRRDGGFVQVDVDDDGPEVAVDLLPRLFEKFASSEGRDLGRGLGLYFCRITLERWRGGAGYERREQGGARFWIRLRAAERELAAAGQP
jgi:signal transduction histidine kinase